MKIGLISDVHSDVDALRRALALLRREKVDELLCLGDLVEKGTQGEAVVMLIQGLAIPCVRGNHDEDAIENQRWLRANLDPNSDNAKKTYLSDMTLDFLKMLPFDIRYEWEGRRVLAVHGSPVRNTEYLFAASPQARYKFLAREVNADVILCGHTHEPMHVKANGVHFLNPGSVCGVHAHGSATCAVLTLPEIEFQVIKLDSGESTRL